MSKTFPEEAMPAKSSASSGSNHVDLYDLHRNVTHIPKRYLYTMPQEAGHTKPVLAVAVIQPANPEENPLVISASEDGTAKVWDLYTQSLVLTFAKHVHDPVKKKEKVTTIATFVHGQNNYVITGSDDCTAIVWDPKSGNVIHVLNAQHNYHNKPISNISVIHPKPAPPVVVVASQDKSFSCWDLVSGQLHYHVPVSGHTDLLLSITCVHNPAQPGLEGIHIITGSWDKTLRYFGWNQQTGVLLKGHTKSVTTVVGHTAEASGRSCQLLVSGSLDKTAIIWDLDSLSKVRVLRGHEEKINAVRVYDNPFDGCPPMVLTASDDKTSILWDMLTGDRLRVFTQRDKISSCDILLTSKYGCIVVTGSVDRDVSAWNLCRIDRVRRLPTAAVTAIDTYVPREGDSRFANPIATVSTIDSTTTVFDLATNEALFKLEGHKSRINGAVIYSPPDPSDPPLLITCAGDASIKVWDLWTHREVRSLVGHKIVVFTLAIYDPSKISGTAPAPVQPHDLPLDRPLLITGGIDQDIRFWDFLRDDTSSAEASSERVPGSTAHTSSGPVGVCLKIIPKGQTHDNFVRSIAVHHPVTHGSYGSKEANEAVLFVTGSYDMTAIIWHLQSGTKLHRLRFHKGFCFIVAIYDPIRHRGHPQPETEETIAQRLLEQEDDDDEDNEDSDEDEAKNKKRKKKGSKKAEPVYSPVVVTGGYDGRTGVWDMATGKRLRVLYGHKESITALALYTPQRTTEDPLVITGSIDKMVIVWNLLSGEPLQTLVGHSDRVCFLHVYEPTQLLRSRRGSSSDASSVPLHHPSKQGSHAPTLVNPLLLSGGDDNVSIVWEDSLYQTASMPVRDAMNRAFLMDLAEEDWPMITSLVRKYGVQVFVENSNLFFLAVKKQRPDFLMKFRRFLTQVLRYIKPLGSLRNPSQPPKSILTYAIERNNLPAIRAILLSWSEAMNTDMCDMLHQRLYHPSYFFPEEDLTLMAAQYPVEFVHFITSLRLVRNHESLMDSTQKCMLDGHDRYEVMGLRDPAVDFEHSWARKFAAPSTYRLIKSYLTLLLGQYQRPSLPQSVTSLMIPLENAGTIEMLSLFVEVSTQLGNVDIFHAEVGIIALRFFWDEYGRRTHVIAMARYVFSLFLFMLCLYLYQYQFAQVNRHQNSQAFLIGVNYILNLAMVVTFIYYTMEEVWQIRAKYRDVLAMAVKEAAEEEGLGGGGEGGVASVRANNQNHNHNNTNAGGILPELPKITRIDQPLPALSTQLSFQAFLFSHFLLDLWNAIDLAVVCTGIAGLMMRLILRRDAPTGRCLLAATSVLMWFKVLYFLRPFSTSGPLVAMILRISYDIRYFLVVLFAVIAGFAQAFWLLSNFDESLLFGTVKGSLYSIFFFMLGQGLDLDSLTDTIIPSFAQFLLVVFLVLVMLLMLNLLIALMGDSYSEMRALGLAAWRKEQASIACDQAFSSSASAAASALHSSAGNNAAPVYLSVLRYTSDTGGGAGADDETGNKLAEVLEMSRMHVAPYTDFEE